MSFQQGLSGLNGAAKSLDVIGNNIANSSTVGFKQSQAQFADIYANSLNGLGGNQPGIGVSVSQIAQQFTQGNFENSANPLDVAINGGGFFRTSVNGTIQYSRNGQFQVDKQGFIVNAQLAQLTGYKADSTGKISTGAPQPIQIDSSDMKPQATTKVDTFHNLNSNTAMPTVTPFNPNDPNSFSKEFPAEVFDSLGNSHVMSTYYVKTGTNTWDIYTGVDKVEVNSMKAAAAAQTDPAAIAARAAYQAAVTAVPANAGAVIAAAVAYAHAAGAAVTTAATAAGANAAQLAAIAATYTGAVADGQNGGLTPDQIDKAIAGATNVPATKSGSLIFTTLGTLDKTAMLALTPPQTLPLTVNLPIFPATGANPSLAVKVDFSNTTQLGTPTSEKAKPTVDGFTGGQLTRFSVGPDGIITGQYSNGKTRALAQVVLANFANPNGLQPLGNNAWAETSSSGGPLVGEPGTSSLGNLRSQSVEVSNVDLTAELVNMITAQRAYQANAQTIKTQDSVLQTLVNLR
ncbi:flagellar hook protein FlgE [Janthinobacterium agaricidamnosum]|uniref:Flagellar hook protein FlgE n=1 Tax=Janthinobacterium agaricidamnosum NBRC 102515 = DSM 9628 TaxID=1349767 RepID=W0V3F2_9BURK|nr:flagellar hook protein FlgE [Janthinobacterium agaricidamnosum]CDG81878.1 flagellar hook protein flgE [Janthinobacterium agaricidamnosum NBRC 102515 = DSM 9628]